jgi:hypothetical protein
MVLGYRSWMEAECYAASTIRGYLFELRMLIDYAVREDLLAKNPFRGISVRVETKPPRHIQLFDEYKLLTFLYSQRRDL